MGKRLLEFFQEKTGLYEADFQGLIEVCEEKGLILFNPFDDIEIKVNGCKPPNNPKDETGSISRRKSKSSFVS